MLCIERFHSTWSDGPLPEILCVNEQPIGMYDFNMKNYRLHCMKYDPGDKLPRLVASKPHVNFTQTWWGAWVDVSWFIYDLSKINNGIYEGSLYTCLRWRRGGAEQVVSLSRSKISLQGQDSGLNWNLNASRSHDVESTSTGSLAQPDSSSSFSLRIHQPLEGRFCKICIMAVLLWVIFLPSQGRIAYFTLGLFLGFLSSKLLKR